MKMKLNLFPIFQLIYDRFSRAALQINITPLKVPMNRKITKTTSQIKFSAVTTKQRIKLVFRYSLCK